VVYIHSAIKPNTCTSVSALHTIFAHRKFRAVSLLRYLNKDYKQITFNICRHVLNVIYSWSLIYR